MSFFQEKKAPAASWRAHKKSFKQQQHKNKNKKKKKKKVKTRTRTRSRKTKGNMLLY